MKTILKSALLFCPYENCRKGFEKPLQLTNPSLIMRETYYACPHCHSKIDITVEDLHVVRVEKCEDGEHITPPANCPHDFGYLKTLQENVSIPDECLTCSKILQCSIKK